MWNNWVQNLKIEIEVDSVFNFGIKEINILLTVYYTKKETFVVMSMMAV